MWSPIRTEFCFSKSAVFQRLRARGRSDEAVWKAVVQRCRRELKRAGRAMREAARDEDAKLYEVAKELSQSSVNALVRMQRAWRAIREDRASPALDAVWKGDKPPTGQAGDGAERARRRAVISSARARHGARSSAGSVVAERSASAAERSVARADIKSQRAQGGNCMGVAPPTLVVKRHVVR